MKVCHLIFSLYWFFSWLNSSIFSSMSHYCYSCTKQSVLGSSFWRSVVQKHLTISPHYNSWSEIIKSSSSGKPSPQRGGKEVVQSAAAAILADKDSCKQVWPSGLPASWHSRQPACPFQGTALPERRYLPTWVTSRVMGNPFPTERLSRYLNSPSSKDLGLCWNVTILGR